MNRRGFLGSLAGLIGTAALDPEKLLWQPEKKTIFIPTVWKPRAIGPTTMSLDEINAMTLRYLNQNIVASVFAPNPFLMSLKRKEALFLGATDVQRERYSETY